MSLENPPVAAAMEKFRHGSGVAFDQDAMDIVAPESVTCCLIAGCCCYIENYRCPRRAELRKVALLIVRPDGHEANLRTVS
jgi:hypothetical protein